MCTKDIQRFIICVVSQGNDCTVAVTDPGGDWVLRNRETLEVMARVQFLEKATFARSLPLSLFVHVHVVPVYSDSSSVACPGISTCA